MFFNYNYIQFCKIKLAVRANVLLPLRGMKNIIRPNLRSTKCIQKKIYKNRSSLVTNTIILYIRKFITLQTMVTQVSKTCPENTIPTIRVMVTSIRIVIFNPLS